MRSDRKLLRALDRKVRETLRAILLTRKPNVWRNYCLRRLKRMGDEETADLGYLELGDGG